MILRIHTCTGLLAFVNLVLYAVVGIAAFFTSPSSAPPVVWEQPFALQPGQGDRETADRVVRLLGLSLATPVHDFAIRHDAQGRLVLDFYHANGRHLVTVLDRPGRLRVEHTRAGMWKYLSTLHVTTAAFRSGDWRMQLWAWWNEFAMWCLAAMTVSGVWVWWQRRGSRGTLRRAHRYTALGALALLSAYEISAIQMAHRTWLKAGPVSSALAKLHRMRGAAFSPLLGMALLVLGATGLCLWWRLGRDRKIGAVLFACGLFLAAGLACCMRNAP